MEKEKIYTICGIRRVDFDAPDGNHVSGNSVYAVTPITSNGRGDECIKFFQSSRADFSCNLDVGKRGVLRYNQYGKVCDFVEVDEC